LSDIAVLQITDTFSNERRMPLTFGNSSLLQVGQQVAAIGNPFGLKNFMTEGIISGIGVVLPPNSTSNVIVTDVPLNPGSMGGPLLNMQGQVVGINTAILSSTGEFSGISYAIPSNTIIKEVPTIIHTGTYYHPWLGISGGAVTPDIAQSVGLPRNYKGVVVASVQSGSPAEKAGIEGTTQNPNPILGDIITAIDGHPLKSMDDLINYIDLIKNPSANCEQTWPNNEYQYNFNKIND
jgi:S1-C subfamily serine protease